MTFHSDYKNLLVSEADILPKLEEAGIMLPTKLTEMFPRLEKIKDDWREIHSLRKVLTAAEAVRAICGIDPSYTWALSEADDQRYDRYMSVLIDAVKHGELFNKVKNPSSAPYEWEIAHSDIYSWCEKNNIPWPFPKPAAPTVNDSNSLNELELEQAKRREAEAEIKRLQQELASLKSSQGINFPYETKELKVMRAIVAKYWENYTPDKRQPTQKEIQQELCKHLGIAFDPYKSPPQKAVYLAAAIKPDDLPSA